jgi:maltoporin
MFFVVRPHYAINTNLAVELEMGYFSGSVETNGAWGNIGDWSTANGEGGGWVVDGTVTEMKITPCVVLALDPGFWSRPQLRLWMNYEMIGGDASKTKGGLPTKGAFKGDDSALTWGVQAEAWW